MKNGCRILYPLASWLKKKKKNERIGYIRALFLKKTFFHKTSINIPDGRTSFPDFWMKTIPVQRPKTLSIELKIIGLIQSESCACTLCSSAWGISLKIKISYRNIKEKKACELFVIFSDKIKVGYQPKTFRKEGKNNNSVLKFHRPLHGIRYISNQAVKTRAFLTSLFSMIAAKIKMLTPFFIRLESPSCKPKIALLPCWSFLPKLDP